MSAAENIEQLMDKLGAEVAVSLKPHRTLIYRELVRDQARVDMMYQADGGFTPEWAQHPRVTCLWAVHTSWSAGHRAFMRRTLLGAGVHDDEVTHLWAWPFDQRDAPLESQLLAYRSVTMSALAAANNRYVIIVGANTLKLWRKELILKQVAGNVVVWESRYVAFPMMSPANVLRDPTLQGQWREQMYKFADVVTERGELEELGRHCVDLKCTDTVMMYDVDGVPWCKRHYQRGIKRRNDHQTKTRTAANSAVQKGML